MKIVITGSRGFIGSHLVKTLQNENEIIEWDTKIDKDIKDFTLEPDTDFVVHLAGLISPRDSIKEPFKYWKYNVEYSKNLFNICKDIPMVYASSAAVKEYWRSPYGITKKVLEELAHDLHVGLRFETIYGDGASDIGLISSIRNGNLKYCTNHIRDFIHIDDIVDSIIFFIEHKELFKEHIQSSNRKRYYEIGTGQPHYVNDVVKHFGVSVPITAGDDIELKSSVADIYEINKIGWKSKRSIYDEK